MGRGTKLIPTSSQTVGPYFRIGLEYLFAVPAVLDTSLEIRGRLLDRDGSPVPDGMLEFWCANARSQFTIGPRQRFRRACTDAQGNFFAVMSPPEAVPLADGRVQAPHMLVLVFARGLLRNLITRVYFEGENANESDPVMLSIPSERRHTLIAKRDAKYAFHWDVVLQGPDETVFFDW
jgi:protocatechuate 3,4-dioxygenase, alpha subunit